MKDGQWSILCKYIKITLWNANSLKHNKTKLLNLLLEKKIDIALITETPNQIPNSISLASKFSEQIIPMELPTPDNKLLLFFPLESIINYSPAISSPPSIDYNPNNIKTHSSKNIFSLFSLQSFNHFTSDETLPSITWLSLISRWWLQRQAFPMGMYIG